MQFSNIIGIIKVLTLAEKTWQITYSFKYVPQPASRPVNPGLRPAAPHNLNAGSVVRATKRLKCIERGDSVVELDNFKSTLQGYKAPLQEVRDSL